MKANAIVCPTLIFIHNDAWIDEEKRERFLGDFNLLLKYLQNNNDCILWNDEMETVLWEAHDLHPWYDHQYYAITTLFHTFKQFDESSVSYDACKCRPLIKCSFEMPDILDRTMGLFHYLIDVSKTVSFLTDKENATEYFLSCDCHSNVLQLSGKYIGNDTFDFDTIIEDKWKQIKNNVCVLEELLGMARDVYFPGEKFVYDPIFDSAFLRTLSAAKENKKNILFKITHRLILLPAQVAKIKSFNDESITGHDDLRSFRTDGVCRIYYKYSDRGRMVFKEYTGESEHDVGTRHT